MFYIIIVGVKKNYFNEKKGIKMKLLKLSLVTSVLLTSATTSMLANDTNNTIVKRTLKGNMNLSYKIKPKSATTISEAFSNGVIYGRLRSNSFYWDWDKEVDGKSKDNKNMGVGASLIFKTAPLNGISLTTGLYTSQNPEFMRMDKNDVKYSKAGKDTFSRDNVKDGGHYGLTVLGQAYLEYKNGKTQIKVGRQLFHSVYTKSNDTKMVPNTFDGVTLVNKDLPKTKLTLAYFTGQKLRDHTSSHDVLAFNSWNENDDSAINKSLTKDLIGTSNKLIIGSINNKSIKNLNLTLNYLTVPDVLNNFTVEGKYKIKLSNGLTITPSVRYMNQSDDLGTLNNVANLKGKTDGYSSPTSLDGSALMAKLDIKKGAGSIRLGWSKISDDADIVAPWRGFVTGGYTRAMAQYNWYANTETFMIRGDYNFGKAGLVSGLKGLIRYAVQDFDDKKPGVQADSNIVHIDLVKQIETIPNLSAKVRIGLVDADDNIVDMNGKTKTDVSYNEYRLEFNYLF